MINGIAFVPTDDEDNTVGSGATPSTMLAITGTNFAYAGDAELALTAASCVLTYTGPTIKVLVTLNTTFSSGGALAGSSRAGIAVNGDIIGLASGDDALAAAGVGKLQNGGGDGGVQITSQRRVVLNNGDTLQPVLGFNNNADLVIEYLTMVVQQLTP